MKRLFYTRILYVLFPLIAAALLVPGAFAQDFSDHVQAGVFGNYSRFGNVNLAGVGARLSVNVFPIVQLEAESTYNFDQGYTSGFVNNGTGTVTVERSNLRSVDFLFGPKIESNRGPVRLFATVKGGFDNYLFSSAPATIGTYTSTFAGLNGNRLDAAFYGGVGAEGFWGPIGLRLDIGDEMSFDSYRTLHNLKVSFGPTIRF